MKFTTVALTFIATVATAQANPAGRIITGTSDPKLPFKSDKWVQKDDGKWSISALDVPDFNCAVCTKMECFCYRNACDC
ncbi:hypothetical protein HDU97_007973 [Phlyctochytrium planicorne]|nr:hypothetical protein HDU97_007973 [Phlyctochytrium planicorne]